MWNEATADASLVGETVTSAGAQRLLYQARANLELFQAAAERLREALNETNFQNFAASQSCHMMEGIFGADKHRAEMEAAKQRTVAFLLATVTAGHRFWRCLIGARQADRGTDWGNLRTDLQLLERLYHKTRNFLEHLDEAIAGGQLQHGLDCQFSPMGVLTCTEPGEPPFAFDFQEAALQRVKATYDKVMDMLRARQATASPTA